MIIERKWVACGTYSVKMSSTFSAAPCHPDYKLPWGSSGLLPHRSQLKRNWYEWEDPKDTALAFWIAFDITEANAEVVTVLICNGLVTTAVGRYALKIEAGESILFGQNGIQYTPKNQSKCFQLENQPSTHHFCIAYFIGFLRWRERS